MSRFVSGEGGALRRALFCHPPRRISWGRPVQVAARTVHIAAMGLLLGGIAYEADEAALFWPIVLTVASGLVLLGVDLARSFVVLYQGSGLAVLVKLALLGGGFVWPRQRLEFYLAATIVASVGSHMTGSWRHYSFLDRRVLEYPKQDRAGEENGPRL